MLLDPNDAQYRPLVPPVAYEPDAARFAAFLAAGVQQFKQPTGGAPLAAR